MNLRSWQDEVKAGPIPEVTALHLAASMGLAKVASLLINEVGDIDAVDDSGKTALAVAMERGFEKAVELLVNSGASVDLGIEHGQGVFLLLTESDWHKAASIVVQRAYATLDVQNDSQRQVNVRIMLAAYQGDASEIERLVEQEKFDPCKAHSRIAAVALFLAIERNHNKTVEALLNARLSVNAHDGRGQTALHRAVRRENVALVRLLLERHADVDAKNDEGRTPWSASVRQIHKPTAAVLIQYGADPNTKGHQGVSELYEASEKGELAVVRFMLECGTNPSIKTQLLWAPLHWAAYYGHMDCVRALVEAGADLSPVSDQDASPLDLSLRANQAAITKYLIRAGAKESREVVISDPETPTREDVPTDGWSTSPLGLDFTNTKLLLAFDKPIQQGMQVGQFAYPSTLKAPKDHVYQLSIPVDTPSSTLSVRKSSRRADMIEYPLAPESFDKTNSLYEILRVAGDYQTFRLLPQAQCPVTGFITMHKDRTGGWKIRRVDEEANDYMFRTTPDWSKMKEDSCRWMTEDATLLARTGVEGVTPVLTFELGIERWIQDLLATCWAVKLWSETMASRRDSVSSAGHV